MNSRKITIGLNSIPKRNDFENESRYDKDGYIKSSSGNYYFTFT